MAEKMIADLARILSLHAQENPQGMPPVHLWEPPLCGEIDLCIHRDGVWSYMGSPIQRRPLVRLFSRVLRRDDDDHYYLVTPVEKMRIRVEDAPLHVVRAERCLTADEQSWIELHTATEDVIRLGPEHGLWVGDEGERGEPAPYVHARARLHARIQRNAFYQLVDWAVPGAAQGRSCSYGVWSGGQFFSLGEVDRELLNA